MCDCIKTIEKHYNDIMLSRDPEARVIERVEIQNKGLMLKSGKNKLYSELSGRYGIGQLRRKYSAKILYAFCPFCGEAVVPES